MQTIHLFGLNSCNTEWNGNDIYKKKSFRGMDMLDIYNTVGICWSRMYIFSPPSIDDLFHHGGPYRPAWSMNRSIHLDVPFSSSARQHFLGIDQEVNTQKLSCHCLRISSARGRSVYWEILFCVWRLRGRFEQLCFTTCQVFEGIFCWIQHLWNLTIWMGIVHIAAQDI